MARLLEFIEHQLTIPFEWGKTDCCSTCNNWVKEYTGFSPLGALDRKYSTENEVQEWLAEPGGIAVAVNRAMKPFFKKTTKPQIGDIGLVFLDNKVFPAIKTENGWFSRSENGFLMANDFWKAWDLCHK